MRTRDGAVPDVLDICTKPIEEMTPAELERFKEHASEQVAHFKEVVKAAGRLASMFPAEGDTDTVLALKEKLQEEWQSPSGGSAERIKVLMESIERERDPAAT